MKEPRASMDFNESFEDQLAYALMLREMPVEELMKIPYSIVKWPCQCKRCTNGTKVYDFGISPWFFSPRKRWGWNNLVDRYLICGKHNKFLNRMMKQGFTRERIEEKIVDWSVLPYERMILISDANMKTVKQIEKK